MCASTTPLWILSMWLPLLWKVPENGPPSLFLSHCSFIPNSSQQCSFLDVGLEICTTPTSQLAKSVTVLDRAAQTPSHPSHKREAFLQHVQISTHQKNNNNYDLFIYFLSLIGFVSAKFDRFRNNEVTKGGKCTNSRHVDDIFNSTTKC